MFITLRSLPEEEQSSYYASRHGRRTARGSIDLLPLIHHGKEGIHDNDLVGHRYRGVFTAIFLKII